MAANYVLEPPRNTEGTALELAFAGDSVRLAGQLDYPKRPAARQMRTSSIHPLVFVLPHAGSNSRRDFDAHAQVALNAGYAVFRWDKRGTGRSGAGVRGSVVGDAINAYDTALHQPQIDRKRVVILAQGEGTVLLGDNYDAFARICRPAGVILIGSMLDPAEILSINTRVQLITGETDWNDWKIYAREASIAHNQSYNHGATYYVARNANRLLTVNQGAHGPFHFGASKMMTDWLLSL